MKQKYLYRVSDCSFLIEDSQFQKTCVGNGYNFVFDKVSGQFARWGEDFQSDAEFSPIGPEILDLEISVNGCQLECDFCYKENDNSKPINLSFDNFKSIIDKMPRTLTQVAFGITDIKSNPDFFEMMKYCLKRGIVPNFTMNGIGLNEEYVNKIVELSGAVAVSVYPKTKEIAYNAIEALTNKGLNQCNIHLMVSNETINFVYEVVKDCQTDKRLKDLNAIVFLGLKPKGRSKNVYSPLRQELFFELCNYCLENNISFGFDSCSAPNFESFIRQSVSIDPVQKEQMISFSESCESGLFSTYINVYGDFFPCSFCEGEENWKTGISVLNCDNFMTDIWYNEKVKQWRNDLIKNTCDNCRKCPVFPEINVCS